MPRVLIVRSENPEEGAYDRQADFYLDRQNRVSHRCSSYGYAKTLYGRVNGEWVKFAYWCPECRVGVLLDER